LKLINKLASASNDAEKLTLFVDSNYQEIYDFFMTQSNSSLMRNRDAIDQYISKNLKNFKKLDLLQRKNELFISILSDVSAYLHFSNSFKRLYRLLEKNDCAINKIVVANNELYDTRQMVDYTKKLPVVLNLLIASLEEEDDITRPISVLLSLYIRIIEDYSEYNIDEVKCFHDRLDNLIYKDENYNALACQTLQDVLDVDFTNLDEALKLIKTKQDSFLNRTRQYTNDLQMLEIDSNYCSLLANVEGIFSDIQKISKDQSKLFDRDSIHYTLNRGTSILDNEQQLYSYMHSFARMHYEKMKSAFQCIQEEIKVLSSMRIIDWGCGQGIATMSFYEEVENLNVVDSVDSICLVEPSEIAIKRAALHCSKLFTNISPMTICADFDSMEFTAVEVNSESANIHLFSNSLDLDSFSMMDLVTNIQSTFSGINYFICVSPYITQLKTSRLDSFVDSFREEYGFKLYTRIDERKGEWTGTNWSRVIRVFKVTL
jgi:hypothetical protein